MMDTLSFDKSDTSDSNYLPDLPDLDNCDVIRPGITSSPVPGTQPADNDDFGRISPILKNAIEDSVGQVQSKLR